MRLFRRPRARPFWRDVDGAAALELAILAPVFGAVLIGIIDVAFGFYVKIQLTEAVSAGAQYAYDEGNGVSQSQISGFLTNIGSAMRGATPLTLNGASVLFNNAADGTNANQCYCLTPAAPVTWTAEACGSPCSATGPTAGKYVTISASYSFRPIIWTSYLQPGLLTDAVLIRVQ